MFFPIQKLLYRLIVLIVRLLSIVIPMKKPTMLLGPGASEHLCVAVAQSGVKKLLIVTDAMLVQLGLHETMVQTLTDNGVESVIYDGVEPDPTFAHVEGGLASRRRGRAGSGSRVSRSRGTPYRSVRGGPDQEQKVQLPRTGRNVAPARQIVRPLTLLRKEKIVLRRVD